MRQSNWPTCPEANHRIVQKWMLMWLVSKTRCILVYNPGNPDQEMFDVIQRCVNYILPPVTPSLIQCWTLTIAGNRLKANKQTTRHATYPASSQAQVFFLQKRALEAPFGWQTYFCLQKKAEMTNIDFTPHSCLKDPDNDLNVNWVQ